MAPVTKEKTKRDGIQRSRLKRSRVAGPGRKRPTVEPGTLNVEPCSKKISEKDQDILRKLAARQAEIAQLPVQETTEMEWRRLNSLKQGRPLVWINEIPWHEMNVNDELTLTTQDEFCRGVEWQLRANLYQWEHLRGDMVVEPAAMSVKLKGAPVDLTYKEFALLLHFLSNPGLALTRDQILQAVWGDDYYGGDRTVDIHVRRLRAKLPPLADHIGTVHGVGYRFTQGAVE